MPSTCLICKKTAKKGSNVSMHRIPPKSEAVNRQKWLVALNLTEDDALEHHRICSVISEMVIRPKYPHYI